jgi:hypothetical protein
MDGGAYGRCHRERRAREARPDQVFGIGGVCRRRGGVRAVAAGSARAQVAATPASSLTTN